MWLLLLASAWAAACPEAPVATMKSSAAAMEVSFTSLDEAAFDRAHAALDEAVPCVTEPLDLRDVLVLHRAMAMSLFMDGDMRASTKSWGAVKALHPEWRLPEAMAPEGHLMRQLFDAASAEGELITLELEPPGGWLVDGRWTSDVPQDRAFVLQALGDEGVTYTGYELSVAGIPITDLVQPGPSPRARKMRKVGTGVAVALAAGSAAGIGLHFHARERMYEVPYREVDKVADRGNMASAGAAVLGGAALTVFVGAWAIRW
jgi:hypothetical protein